MKNPFKRKKANRFRGYNPTKEELQAEFERELQYRVGQRMKLALGEKPDMETFFKYRMEHGDTIQKEERAKLIQELKDKGYSNVLELQRQSEQTVLLKKIPGGKYE